MIRRAAYQQVVVVDAPPTTLLPTPPTHLYHSHAHSQHSQQAQQIHKIPIHLIKRSRAVLVKDLERLAPGVTRVVTDQGAVLYPDSPDNLSSTVAPSRSPTFSGSVLSGGSQAYIPILEGEEDNSIWFVHSRPGGNAARSIQTPCHSNATRNHHSRPVSMMEHGSQGVRSAAHQTSPLTKKETSEAVFEKEVLQHEHEQDEELHHDSWTRTTHSHPPRLHQAQEQSLESICGQSQAAGRTRVQEQELSTANRQNHRRIGSQESSSSQHQDLDVAQCENPRCQETVMMLAGFAQAVLASLGGDGQGDILALQKMAIKILESTSSTLLATPPQSAVFSTSSSSVSNSALGMMTPETTPVSTPVMSASRTHASPPPVLLSQHQGRSSSSSSIVLSPPTTIDSFQAALLGQYPNPASLTLPGAMIAVESPKKTKKKKSGFLAIFQHRGEGDERLAQGQGKDQAQGTVESKKAWYKSNRRRQTLPTLTTSDRPTSSQASTSSGGTSQPSTPRRFSVPFGFHIRGASSASSNNAAPPTPSLPPFPSPPISGQRQNAQYPAGRRPSTARPGARMQVGTGSFLDSVSDESTTEDEEEEEEVLERRGVAPQQLLQQSVQRRERYQVYDNDESTDTESEDSDEEDSDEDDSEEDTEDSDDDEEEQVERPRGQERRPWRRSTVRQSSTSSSSTQQTQHERQQQGHIRWATSPSSADQTRQTLEGYEHDFDDAPPPAYQSSDVPPPSQTSSSSQSAVIMPLSVSGSLARQQSIPPRNYHSSSSASASSHSPTPRATVAPPAIPTRPLSISTFPAMQVISSSSSSSSLPTSAPLSRASTATSSSSITSSSTSLHRLLSLLHSLEARLSAPQRSSFTKQPSSPERNAWRARQPGTVASFAYVLIALEQTGLAPGAMSASWREARDGGRTKEEEWLAMTGNAATEKDLARALLVLAKEGLGELAWGSGGDEEEGEEVGSWDEWVERVEAYIV